MAVDDGGERSGQIGKRIDSVRLACFNQRGDGRPVLRSGVMTGEESVLPVERYRPDGSFDAVIVNLDAPVTQEDAETIPVFGNLGPVLPQR